MSSMSGHTIEDRGHRVKAANYALLVLGTLAVILRFCGRYIAHKAGFWWDDWLSLVALPFLWAVCGLSLYWVSIGLGKHIAEIPGSHSRLAVPLLADNLLYNTGLTLVKISVLMFYVRVFKTVVAYRVAFWITGAIIVSWCVAINFLATFTCIPVHKSWAPAVPGHCLDSSSTFLGATIPNIVIDFILLVLPMPMLLKLQIEISSKVALIGVFAAGYCVLILSTIRLTSIIGIGNKLEKDLTWNLAYPQILITVELAIALISSCLPSIFNLVKHALRRYGPSIFASLRKSNPLGGPGGSNIGPAGNPIEENRHKGFVQLESGRNHNGGSNERLFDGVGGPYATAYPSHQGDRKEDTEQGIPLDQIHVRDDVYVDALSGRDALERIVV